MSALVNLSCTVCLGIRIRARDVSAFKVLINPKWVFGDPNRAKKVSFFIERLVVEMNAVKRASLATFWKKVRIRVEAWVPGTNFHSQ